MKRLGTFASEDEIKKPYEGSVASYESTSIASDDLDSFGPAGLPEMRHGGSTSSMPSSSSLPLASTPSMTPVAPPPQRQAAVIMMALDVRNNPREKGIKRSNTCGPSLLTPPSAEESQATKDERPGDLPSSVRRIERKQTPAAPLAVRLAAREAGQEPCAEASAEPQDPAEVAAERLQRARLHPADDLFQAGARKASQGGPETSSESPAPAAGSSSATTPSPAEPEAELAPPQPTPRAEDAEDVAVQRLPSAPSAPRGKPSPRGNPIRRTPLRSQVRQMTQELSMKKVDSRKCSVDRDRANTSPKSLRSDDETLATDQPAVKLSHQRSMRRAATTAIGRTDTLRSRSTPSSSASPTTSQKGSPPEDADLPLPGQGMIDSAFAMWAVDGVLEHTTALLALEHLGLMVEMDYVGLAVGAHLASFEDITYPCFNNAVSFCVKRQREEVLRLFASRDREARHLVYYHDALSMLRELGLLLTPSDESVFSKAAGLSSKTVVECQSIFDALVLVRDDQGLLLSGDRRRLQEEFDHHAVNGELPLKLLRCALYDCFGPHLCQMIHMLTEGFDMRRHDISFSEFMIWIQRLRRYESKMLLGFIHKGDNEDGVTYGKVCLDMAKVIKTLKSLNITPLPHVYKEFLFDESDPLGALWDALRCHEGFNAAEAAQVRAAFLRVQPEKVTPVDGQVLGTTSCYSLLCMLRFMGYHPQIEDVFHSFIAHDSKRTDKMDFKRALRVVRHFRERYLGLVDRLFAEEVDRYLTLEAAAGHHDMPGDKLPRRFAQEVIKHLVKETGFDYVQENGMIDQRTRSAMTFEEFVQLLDSCSMQRSKRLRRYANFTEEEANLITTAFDLCASSSKTISVRTGLPGLLKKFGVPMHTLKDRKRALSGQAWTAAWNAALIAGWDFIDLGHDEGDAMTLPVFMHLLRHLASYYEEQQVTRESAAIEETGYDAAKVSKLRQEFKAYRNEMETSKKQRRVKKDKSERRAGKPPVADDGEVAKQGSVVKRSVTERSEGLVSHLPSQSSSQMVSPRRTDASQAEDAPQASEELAKAARSGPDPLEGAADILHRCFHPLLIEGDAVWVCVNSLGLRANPEELGSRIGADRSALEKGMDFATFLRLDKLATTQDVATKTRTNRHERRNGVLNLGGLAGGL